MFGKRRKNTLDEKLDLLQNNLENNYKDEAHRAYREAVSIFGQMKEEGQVPAKQLAKYQERLAEYAKKLEGYGHYNNLEALRFTDNRTVRQDKQ